MSLPSCLQRVPGDSHFRRFPGPGGLPALIACLGAALLAAPGCAYNATGLAPPKMLIAEFSVEGDRLVPSPNWAYYLVIDTNGNPEDAPLVNGPAPLQFPYPDPRAYLPFVRDERSILDREPVAVPNSVWSTYFALYEEAGQFVLWQGRPNADGTINERDRQLQQGREWTIKDNKTLQLTLPFTLIREPGKPSDFEDPPQWEANLAVALRGNARWSRDFVIDRWGQVQNFSFPILTRPINQTLYDTVGGVRFPQNLPAGVEAPNMNIVSFTYRVVSEAAPRR
ncbi:MAG: hypothetical protein VKP62_03530 [Candidatus Sericytochromatia bacterium]|nr:hypothetical protein [Candidatus Sericytochromatia bacterium]